MIPLWFPEALECSDREAAGSVESLKLNPQPHELRKVGTAGLKHTGGLSVSSSDVHALLWYSLFGAFPDHTI